MRRFICSAAGLLAAGTASLAIGISASGSAAPHPVPADLQRYAAAPAAPAAPAALTATVPGNGRTMTVRAVVDYRRHRAVGSYEETPGGGESGGAGLLAWDGEGLATAHSDVALGSATEAADAAGALPREAWTRRGWARGSLDTALRLMLARSGPMWLRDERTGARSYGVFPGARPRPRASSPAGRPVIVEFAGARPGTTVPAVPAVPAVR